MATMKNKSVGFNIESEEEKQLLEYCEKVENFAKYAKALIRADMMRRQQAAARPQVVRQEDGGISVRL